MPLPIPRPIIHNTVAYPAANPISATPAHKLIHAQTGT